MTAIRCVLDRRGCEATQVLLDEKWPARTTARRRGESQPGSSGRARRWALPHRGTGASEEHVERVRPVVDEPEAAPSTHDGQTLEVTGAPRGCARGVEP